MARLALDGFELHYRLDGDEGAPMLVLSNGLGTDLSMWDPQMPAFVERFRVLRYDPRGHGASSVAPGPCSIERLAGDVLRLLDALRVSRAHFCGFSIGGQVGMWLGTHASGRLERLVLANTAARIGPVDMWNARIGVVETRGMAAIADAAITRWFTPAFIAAHPGAVRAHREAFERTSPEGYVGCCAAIRDADFREAVAGIRVPALLISGRHDAATTPADMRFLAERIPGSRLVELDAAHMTNIETAPAFDRAVLDFCRSTETLPQ